MPNWRLKNSLLTSGWCHSGCVPFFTLWLESVFTRPSVHLKSRRLFWCGPTVLLQIQRTCIKRVIVATISFYLSAFCFSDRLECETVLTRPGRAVMGDGRRRLFGDVKPGFGFSVARRPWCSSLGETLGRLTWYRPAKWPWNACRKSGDVPQLQNHFV